MTSPRTTSSATSCSAHRSIPVAMPIRSSTATSASVWVLPAPAPRPASEVSTSVAPSSIAAAELATASERLLCSCMPTATSAGSAARIAAIRRRTSSGRNAPAESTMKTPCAARAGDDPRLLGHALRRRAGGRCSGGCGRSCRARARGRGAGGRCRPRCRRSRRARPSRRRRGPPRGRAWCRRPGRIATAISRPLDDARPPRPAARRRSAAAGRTGSSSRRGRRRGRRRSPTRRRGRAPRATVSTWSTR